MAGTATTDDAAVTTLVPADLVTLALGVNPGTLRSWASRGKVRRHGKDPQGRTLYDLDEVERVTQVDTRQRVQHHAR